MDKVYPVPTLRKAAVIGAALFVFASASSDLAPGTKIVFLKGNEVVSANADGSDQRFLLTIES